MKIEICLGSSCHSKGSNKIVLFLKEYVKKNSDVKLSGLLCTDRCENGPILIINGKTYTNVTESNVLHILNKHKNKA